MPTSYKLDTAVLDKMVKSLGGDTTKAVAKLGFLVEGKAKVNAPVDTGALRASIYTSMQHSEAGRDAMNEARSRRPEAVITPLPVPKDSHTAHVGPSVEYGEEVELGSSTRPGTPYLQPAMRAVEAEAKKVFAEMVKPK